MNKKILLSVAASALLTTSVFAGTLSFTQPHTVLSTESHMQNGLDEINATSLSYTPDFNVNPRPSGLIPEASIQLDISDIEFPLSLVNDVLGTDYDADGKGIAATSLTIDELGIIFDGTSWSDTSPGDTLGDLFTFEHAISSGTTVLLNFGSDTNTLYKDHTYIFVDPNTTPDELSFKFNALSGAKLKISTFHPDIDDEAIDTAEAGYEVTLEPQFSVACVRKFDGLINFENDRLSFVNPAHGARAEYEEPLFVPDADVGANDTMVNRDRMIFTIDNARADNAVRWMGGHATQFTFQADNSNNAFATWTDSTVKMYHTPGTPDDIDTLNTPQFTANLAAGTRDTVLPTATGTFVFDELTDTFTITYPNEELQIGTTTFVVDLVKPNDILPLRAVQFVNPLTDLEAGLNLADDDRSDIVQNGHPSGPNHFVLNDEDDSGVIAPQNQTTAAPTNAGEWMDHAFIAQIPGATQTDTTQTKLFIVNRSCVPVTPKFRLIKDGVVIEVDGEEIAVDSQQKTTLASIVPEDGQYAVEIIIPGIAEDFYVYAQAQGMVDKTITKDLPVYNTSSRD